MRILFVGNVPKSRLYGVPRILLSLGDELGRLGHRVDYLSSSDVPLPHVPAPLRPVAFAAAVAPKLVMAGRRGKYDVIAAHSGSGWVYGALRRAMPSTNAAYVLLSQGWEELLWDQFLRESRTGATPLSRRHRLLYPIVHIGQVRLAARLADAVVCCSTEERSHVIGSLGIPDRRVHFVPNGVGREYLELDHSYPVEASRLLCVAYWNWRKGQNYLLDAYSRLSGERPELKLSLVGTRLARDSIQRLRGAELPEGVRVVPEVDEPALLQEYLSHDVMVLPSLFEGMSLAMLEAMAAGLPVITTAVSGALDVVEDGINGILVPARDSRALAEAIERIRGDVHLRRRLANAARSSVEAQTWDKIALKLIDVFENARQVGR